jgi:hypothetical protein
MAVLSDSLVPLVPFSPESVHLLSSMGQEGSSPPRQGSPVEDWMNDKQRRLAEVAAKKMAESPVFPSSCRPRPVTRTGEPEIQPPAKAASVKIVKAAAVPTAELPEGLKKVVSDSKEAASPQAPAGQPTGAKAPTLKKGQVKGQTLRQQSEGPEAQVQAPIATRTRSKTGSRAGGFRPGVGGSGQTDTRVASSHPSKT